MWLTMEAHLQYCVKVMQVKCAHFVLCSCLKVRVEFRGVSRDNLPEQSMKFLRNFSKSMKLCEN